MSASSPYPGLELQGMEVSKAIAARAKYMAALRKAECSMPELCLRVSATPVGLRLVATIYRPGPRFHRAVETISEAVWTPARVTERAVIDWAQRALAKWLEEHPEPPRLPPPPPEMEQP